MYVYMWKCKYKKLSSISTNWIYIKNKMEKHITKNFRVDLISEESTTDDNNNNNGDCHQEKKLQRPFFTRYQKNNGRKQLLCHLFCNKKEDKKQSQLPSS